MPITPDDDDGLEWPKIGIDPARMDELTKPLQEAAAITARQCEEANFALAKVVREHRKRRKVKPDAIRR